MHTLMHGMICSVGAVLCNADSCEFPNLIKLLAQVSRAKSRHIEYWTDAKLNKSMKPEMID